MGVAVVTLPFGDPTGVLNPVFSGLSIKPMWSGVSIKRSATAVCPPFEASISMLELSCKDDKISG